METLKRMKGFVCGEPAGGMVYQTPGLLACIREPGQEGSSSVHIGALLGWSNKPGHLHLSLVVLGNLLPEDPERKLLDNFPQPVQKDC